MACCSSLHSIQVLPNLSNIVSCKRNAALCVCLLMPISLIGCNKYRFPVYPASYHEFAYVSNGSDNAVTVLDLVYVRRDRVLQVGREPTGMAVNPVRNEVYVANAGSDSISVIDTVKNEVVRTIGVHHTPYFLDVAPDGKRAYVANSGSNTVSVVDLDQRREIAVAATGEAPGVVRVAPDNRTLVVSNRVAGSISVYSIHADDAAHPLELRSSFPGCMGATDVAIVPNSTQDLTSGSKAFVACSGAHNVMVVWLAAAADSYRGKQDASLLHDRMLCLLDVGKTPTHLAVKPDGGEVFSTNFDSDSISEISTWTNDVSGTYVVGSKPSRAIVSKDDSSLWVTDFGSDSATMYSIDDGRAEFSVHTGSRPDAIVFSDDEHLMLVTDAGSSDVAVIRMQGKDGPTLFTMLPGGAHPNDIVVKSFHAKLPTR